MNIIITGVGGFIGSHIARKFIKEGYTVFGVDDFSAGKIENVPDGLHLITGDIANKNTISQLPEHADYVLHLAGQSSGEISFDNPVEDLHKNVITTINLIEYGIQSKAKKLLYASSMSVYGNVDDRPIAETTECQPLSCYGVGKLAAEGYLKVYSNKLPFIALRMYNVYGPGQDLDNLRQGMISIFLAQAIKNKNVHVKGSLSRFRDFIHIDDVVDIWYRLTFMDADLNEAINVGTGIKTTIDSLLKSMHMHLPEMSWFTEGNTPGDQSGIYADNSKLTSILDDIKFIPLEEGMKGFVSWVSMKLLK